MYPFVQVFATRLSQITRFAPETLETRGSERFGMDFVPKENVEIKGDLSRNVNPRSDEERRVACRVHRCYRRRSGQHYVSGRLAK